LARLAGSGQDALRGSDVGLMGMARYRFPMVRYADADGVSVAYEVRGEGPVDLVRVPGSFGGLLATYLDPIAEEQVDAYARFSRVIALDRRGTGLSDPLLVGAVPPLEQRVADVIAVLDAIGSDRAALTSGADGCQVSIMCAAMHPDRIDALILSNGFARFFRSDDYPYGLDPALAPLARQRCREEWGNLDHPWSAAVVAPSRTSDPNFPGVLARVQQVCATPATAGALSIPDSDVTDVLPLVQCPTLVVYPADAGRDYPAHAQFLAGRIPNARLASVTGADIYYGVTTPERTVLIEEFVTGSRRTSARERVLATVLFTDIVASTERAAQIGDAKWREELDRHDAVVRDELARFRGREISTAGDSFFATFDGPARAVNCARAIIDAAARFGLDIRAGVHTGECEVRGDDFGGIAVHIGARVAGLAGGGQVLTTSTVKDLVAGADITFADRGTHQLKGIPDPWHLYEVI
jgi:class 3 adenylate cyclase